MRTFQRGMTLAAVALLASQLAGCVSVAEFRRLERDVRAMKSRDGGGGGREQLADVNARLDAIDAELRRLRGQVEVSDHKAASAVEEARKARRDAQGPSGTLPPEAMGPAPEGAAPGEPAPLGSTPSGVSAIEPASGSPPAARPDSTASVAPTTGSGAGASTDEVSAYRSAFAAWQRNDADACIDQFRQFLQAYPSSLYADDSAYWMADCFYKKGDYKLAVMRFDDVVARYPKGNKAADALYRHGESLLKLGPAYQKAARRAFERVTQEYPDSPRTEEAKRQIELLEGSSGATAAKPAAPAKPVASKPAASGTKSNPPSSNGTKPAAPKSNSGSSR